MASVDPDVDVEPETLDYSDESSTFGDRLVRAREAVGLSQEEFATRIGVKGKTLRNWEEDRAEPRANKLMTLAGMLNVSIVWLMSGDGTQPDFATSAPEESIVGESIAELRRLRGEQARLMDRMERLERNLETLL